MGLSHRSWSPATTGPPGPSAANYVAVDDPPGPSMAAMDGPLCRKWSPTIKPLKVNKTVAGIPKEQGDCLVKAPCTFVAIVNGE